MKTKILQKTLLGLTAGFAAALAPITVHAQGDAVLDWNAVLLQSERVSESCNEGVCAFVFQGNGSANIMGPITWTANVVQDFNVTPCNTWLAEITLVGATGSITVSDSCGIACPSNTPSGFPLTISSVWNVTGGTGQFNGITGSGTNQGTKGPSDGPRAKLTGILGTFDIR
jgi:hypothetical protein